MRSRLVLRTDLEKEDCGFRTIVDIIKNTTILLITTNKDMLGWIVVMNAHLSFAGLILRSILKTTASRIEVVFPEYWYDVGSRKILYEAFVLVKLRSTRSKISKLHFCIKLGLGWCLHEILNTWAYAWITLDRQLLGMTAKVAS